MSPLFLTTAGVTATLNAVSRTCTAPKQAVQFLELLNTDVEFYNLMCNGIKGQHWVWVDEAKRLIGYPEGMTGETVKYHPNADWMFGCVFNWSAWTEAAASENIWEATRQMNADAEPSSVLGFAFVQDDVKAWMRRSQRGQRDVSAAHRRPGRRGSAAAQATGGTERRRHRESDHRGPAAD